MASRGNQLAFVMTTNLLPGVFAEDQIQFVMACGQQLDIIRNGRRFGTQCRLSGQHHHSA